MIISRYCKCTHWFHSFTCNYYDFTSSSQYLFGFSRILRMHIWHFFYLEIFYRCSIHWIESAVLSACSCIQRKWTILSEACKLWPMQMYIKCMLADVRLAYESIIESKFIVVRIGRIDINVRCIGRWTWIEGLRSYAACFFRSLIMWMHRIFDCILSASFTIFSANERNWKPFHLLFLFELYISYIFLSRCRYLSARSKSAHSESTNSTFSSPNSSSCTTRSSRTCWWPYALPLCLDECTWCGRLIFTFYICFAPFPSSSSYKFRVSRFIFVRRFDRLWTVAQLLCSRNFAEWKLNISSELISADFAWWQPFLVHSLVAGFVYVCVFFLLFVEVNRNQLFNWWNIHRMWINLTMSFESIQDYEHTSCTIFLPDENWLVGFCLSFEITKPVHTPQTY